MATKDRQISEYESKIVDLEGKLGVLEIQKSKEEEEEATTPSKQQQLAPATLLSRCSSSDFKVEDVALFIENDKGQYEAVNFNSPHYYLSPESLDLSKTQNSRKKH